MAGASSLLIGAPTKFELLLVLGRPFGSQGLSIAAGLIESYGIEVCDWTSQLADIAGQALVSYGKGRHPAQLNFGDCMAYALAKSLNAPLLYKGGDFAKTDIRSAL